MRMGLLPAIAAVLIAVPPADRAAARAHYEAGRAQGQELRFLWQPEMNANLTAAVMYQVVASSRQPLLDGTVPYRVPGTNLLALDLNMLGWRVEDWSAICGFEHNGYATGDNPLVVPAGWWLNEIADGRESDGYLRFVFGGKVPKTEDQFLAAFGIDRKNQGGLQMGWVEGDSAVNLTKDGARLVEFSDGIQSTAWVTYDVQDVADGADPLQGLFAGKFKHDASEFFVLAPKVSTTGTRGVFPFTGLADGAGRIQAEAPVAIVKDTTETFGDPVIANPGSCVSCHTEGPKQQGLNALRDSLGAGVELKTYEQRKQLAADLFHLGEVSTALDRWEADYTAALKAVNGLTPLENATGFRQALATWRQDVTLETAAAELSVDPELLRNSIAWASARYIDVQVRTARLAHGRSMPRETFEQEYRKLQKYIEDYDAQP